MTWIVYEQYPKIKTVNSMSIAEYYIRALPIRLPKLVQGSIVTVEFIHVAILQFESDASTAVIYLIENCNFDQVNHCFPKLSNNFGKAFILLKTFTQCIQRSTIYIQNVQISAKDGPSKL